MLAVTPAILYVPSELTATEAKAACTVSAAVTAVTYNCRPPTVLSAVPSTLLEPALPLISQYTLPLISIAPPVQSLTEIDRLDVAPVVHAADGTTLTV